MCFTHPYRLIWQVVPPLIVPSLHLFLSPSKKFLGRREGFQFIEIHCFNSVIVPARSISLLQCLVPVKRVKTLVGDTACLAVPESSPPWASDRFVPSSCCPSLHIELLFHLNLVISARVLRQPDRRLCSQHCLGSWAYCIHFLLCPFSPSEAKPLGQPNFLWEIPIPWVVRQGYLRMAAHFCNTWDRCCIFQYQSFWTCWQLQAFGLQSWLSD